MISANTKEELDTILNTNKNRKNIVGFFQTNHPQSIQMNDVFTLLIDDYPHDFNWICVSIEDLNSFYSEFESYHIDTLPTILFFDGFTEKERLNKPHSSAFVSLVHKFKSTINSSSINSDEIQSSPLMDFATVQQQNPFVLVVNTKELTDYRLVYTLTNSMDLYDIERQIVYFDTLQNADKELILSHSTQFPQLYVLGNYVPIPTSVYTKDDINDLNLFNTFVLQQKILYLTKSYPIMLFIKGTKAEPFCKFTRELLSIFEKENICDFQTYNILEDEDVRQELKKFSQWPTYPQIYINGNFIGGLDIIKTTLELEGVGKLREQFSIIQN